MADDTDFQARHLQAQRAVARQAYQRREQEYINTAPGPESASALIQQSWVEALERVLAKRNPPVADAD